MTGFAVGVFTIISIAIILYIPYRLWKWISEENRELIVVWLQIGFWLITAITFIKFVGDVVVDLLS
jgi:hypothetical protein